MAISSYKCLMPAFFAVSFSSVPQKDNNVCYVFLSISRITDLRTWNNDLMLHFLMLFRLSSGISFGFSPDSIFKAVDFLLQIAEEDGNVNAIHQGMIDDDGKGHHQPATEVFFISAPTEAGVICNGISDRHEDLFIVYPRQSGDKVLGIGVLVLGDAGGRTGLFPAAPCIGKVVVPVHFMPQAAIAIGFIRKQLNMRCAASFVFNDTAVLCSAAKLGHTVSRKTGDMDHGGVEGALFFPAETDKAGHVNLRGNTRGRVGHGGKTAEMLRPGIMLHIQHAVFDHGRYLFSVFSTVVHVFSMLCYSRLSALSNKQFFYAPYLSHHGCYTSS